MSAQPSNEELPFSPGAFEERIKTLEAFHHWATTQVFIELGRRADVLESALGTLQQTVVNQEERIRALEPQQRQHQEYIATQHPPFTQSQSNQPVDYTRLVPRSKREEQK